jgi:hypothetical protein
VKAERSTHGEFYWRRWQHERSRRREMIWVEYVVLALESLEVHTAEGQMERF